MLQCISVGLTAAAKGVTVNATGTDALLYADYIDDVSADDPIMKRRVKATIPMNKIAKIKMKS